ncbi:Peptidyl-prolyl cis-trans isomerase-like 2 [Madurella mycetomatis]|uniref:Peptidyl-prolyl cis-trans isomerase-like 2 n=1 Tax=Madurella mycetomatis TaxID=100816 RepID=A0A175W5I3_9PEZI|nr:Peptidyl-prolyl cis-trans isomerase-like 2 [Madurella mycetomatis]KXX78996.1 Peptidyl-prolyl cis-trans isomerase-like 2 [Madurella mycetomatis]
MGKGTDKLYITHSEWSSSDAYSASVGANAGSRAQRSGAAAHASFKRLPFNFCAASLQPFRNPVCIADGTIFDVEVISAWLEKHATNPVNGEPLAAKDLIRLNFARNADTSAESSSTSGNGVPTDGKGDFIDPVTFKVFTDNTHIVAVRHGSYANVFAWETVERMNIKAKMWRDLVDDAEFGRKDIITLQDPQNAASRDLSQFKHLQDGQDALPTREQEEQRQQGGINIDALGRIGDKVLRAKEAVQRARQAREGGDVNRTTKSLTLSKPTPSPSSSTPREPSIQEKKLPANAAAYTTGLAAASFTSTGLTPSTSGERALLSDEEYMLHPKRIKHKGYARIETNLGPLTVELHTETAPKAVWNFVRLAQKGYYRGVTFHRSIPNFMIQGGDPTGTGRGGQSVWGKNFADELEGPHAHDARGVVSMANKGKNTNSSQFFVTYRPARHLDRKHTIFGRVLDDDLSTLDEMERTPTEQGTNRPLRDIVIRDVVVFVDPFEEFLKEKSRKEAEGKAKAEIARRGGTEDDKTTWTGKRIRSERDAGRDAGGGGGPAVGKYLQSALVNSNKSADGKESGKDEGGPVEMWEEPARKKAKIGGGGFGNFDGW